MVATALASPAAVAWLAHLKARGIRETWYDPVVDEATLLDRHYYAVGRTLGAWGTDGDTSA